jgi:hypothetical protein
MKFIKKIYPVTNKDPNSPQLSGINDVYQDEKTKKYYVCHTMQHMKYDLDDPEPVYTTELLNPKLITKQNFKDGTIEYGGLYALRSPLKHIKVSMSESGQFSSVRYIYLDRSNKRYYISSHDVRNISTKLTLKDSQMITRDDIINKKVLYHGSYWKL